MPKTHSPYTPEYRRQMVELVRSGRTPGELAREFECSVSAIRNWVRQADRDEGRREDGLTTAQSWMSYGGFVGRIVSFAKNARYWQKSYGLVRSGDRLGAGRSLRAREGESGLPSGGHDVPSCWVSPPADITRGEAVGALFVPSATRRWGARFGPFTRQSRWHLWGASGPCRADGRRLPGEPQTGGSSDARGRVGRGKPTPRHAHHASGAESSCGPGPGRTPVPGRCAGPALGGRRDLCADLWTGFVYLAIVLDVFSRRVVGWSMTHPLRTELVLGALNMALGQRRPDGVVHHSDRGSQYTSLAFGKRCREMGVLPSTGSAGTALTTP